MRKWSVLIGVLGLALLLTGFVMTGIGGHSGMYNDGTMVPGMNDRDMRDRIMDGSRMGDRDIRDRIMDGSRMGDRDMRDRIMDGSRMGGHDSRNAETCPEKPSVGDSNQSP